MPTVFDEIIAGTLPCDKVAETNSLLAFKDISPVAPVHLLIIPKKSGITSLQQLAQEDLGLLSEITQLAQNLAEEYGIADGYRLITNVGPNAGQTVFHLHFHLIGGKKMGPPA